MYNAREEKGRKHMNAYELRFRSGWAHLNIRFIFIISLQILIIIIINYGRKN